MPWAPPAHRTCRAQPRPRQRGVDRRPSASDRGYGVQWRRFVADFLLRHPLCERCARWHCAGCGHAPLTLADFRRGQEGARVVDERPRGACARCGAWAWVAPRIVTAELGHHIERLRRGGAHCSEAGTEALCGGCHGIAGGMERRGSPKAEAGGQIGRAHV